MRWPVQYCCYVLEMHIFSNTHLEGLYNSYRSHHRTWMSASTRTVSSQCTHACSANTLNHRTFFSLKKNNIEKNQRRRRLKKSLQRSWDVVPKSEKVPGTSVRVLKKEKWVIVLVHWEWRLPSEGCSARGRWLESRGDELQTAEKRGVGLLLCYAQVLPRWVNSI